MIMRRIAQHLKQQHWTGVFIELLIVVLGVFIGLQVNNWNQARHDRALERQYLVRLKQDMQASIKIADRDIRSMRWQHQLEGDMLKSLATCQLSPAGKRQFATGLLFAGHFQPPPLVRATIAELRSTGRLGLIRNVKLRQELATVWQFNTYNAGVLRMIIARSTPPLAILDQNRVFHEPKGGWFKQPIGLYVEPGSVSFDFPTLCKDPHYAPAVSTLRVVTGVLAEQYMQLRASFQHALNTINTNLKRSDHPGRTDAGSTRT